MDGSLFLDSVHRRSLWPAANDVVAMLAVLRQQGWPGEV